MLLEDFLTMRRQQLSHLCLSLGGNILLGCTIVPLVITPFGAYYFSTLLEVLLWQCIGMVGWPFALLGMALSIPIGASLTSTASFLFILLYPAIQFLLVRSVISKAPRRLDIFLLHALLILSFISVWCCVLHGFDFMVG